MRNQILEDLKKAMKNKDKETLAVIRMVKGAMQMEELDKKFIQYLTKQVYDEEIISLISKQIKTRKESIIEFAKGSRNDLIEKTEAEIKILEKYLPEQLSKEEVIKLIDSAFEKVKPESMKDMGKLMSIIKPQVTGKFDMGEISKIIKQKINQ